MTTTLRLLTFTRELDERFNFDFDPCPYCEGEVVDGLSIEGVG